MPNDRLFSFRSGGWVLLVAGLICLGLVAWAIAPAIVRSMNRPPGDGENIESYGFDLSNLLVERDLVAAAMLHRDMAPAMTNPTASGPDAALPNDDPDRWRSMQRRNDLKYGKYLVSSDMVIGVELNGEARAYPISILYVHEIINDTLGGAPIAVTYHWLCDSVAVFDRRVNGQTLEFGVSGLVYNSNLLMYDRRPTSPPGGESLWCQMQARAVSGPLAGTPLNVLPAAKLTWGQWMTLHPNTTVVDRDLRMTQRYKDAAPTDYLQSDDLLFPVRPLPSGDGPSLKAPVLAVATDDARRVYPVSYLVEMSRDGQLTDTLGSTPIRILCDAKHRTARVDPANGGVNAVHAYWFAWHAMHPEDELVDH